MNIGEFDRQITLERAVSSQDAIGAVTNTWATLAEVWGSVVPMTGTEVFRSGRVTSGQVARFRIWYFPGLTVKDRINYDSQLWNISYVREIGRACMHEILAETVT
jgi:SPP1 family predicted phage head-tail adaptor